MKNHRGLNRTRGYGKRSMSTQSKLNRFNLEDTWTCKYIKD